ncbi:hypothetical protein CEP54_005278 [Fusarium duplospermum]|uniref:Uncharacterized protein n=1 Tax=Fusarium duplospermum TaxID=1325734 RepID=A0A428QD30_9HYPO|nr:hypothetical protein CEP54_005278 [Fusarium duplospermum]
MNAEAEKAWLLNPKPLSAPEVQLNHRAVKVRNSLGALSDETLQIDENGSAAIFWQKWIKSKFSMKKINASNKRAGEDTQKTVMGNVSAPDRHSTGLKKWCLTNAEWLHLAGFAYGGFMMTGDTSGWSTSQNPHNLVFGTSETNSLMTRYESAWQTFLLYEYELQKMNNIIQLIDSKKRNAREMPKIVSADGQLLVRTNVPESDLDEKMHKAAEDYFFIAHTIEYTLLYEHVSHMLKKPTFQQTVHFFPFSRPLLHKLEAELDRKLMTHLYKSAKRDLTKANGSKLGVKKRRKVVKSINRKQANAKEEEKYFDFEGYDDFSELILGLDLGELGDFESFQDMAMITDFGQFGRAVAVENGEDIVTDEVEDDLMEEQIGKVSIFDEIAIFKAKGKKDQEKPWGFNSVIGEITIFQVDRVLIDG